MWNIKTIDVTKPLYLAVLEVLERDIRSGFLRPGERLPTHRNLAKLVGMNLSTASRVYREAEKRGFVKGVVGRGTFVTVDLGKKPCVIDVEQKTLDLDLGVTKPLPHTDPDIWPIARKILHKRRLPALMSYPDPQGLPEHRGTGSDWLTRYGLKVPPKDVIITAGSQHTLFIIYNSLFAPGDRIATDSLTCLGNKTAAQCNGVRLEGVPMDSAGMLPHELEALCNRHRIKGIYINGKVQIPTNRKMPYFRRVELHNVIRKHQLLVIENDLYGFLSDSPEDTFSGLMPENSIYISSLSRAFLGGLRLAYVAAPANFTKKLTQGVADSMLAVSPLCAELASECIRAGLADVAIMQKRQAMATRMHLFQKIFTGHSYEGNEQCMHTWLSLPRGKWGLDLEREAARHRIRIFAAEKFAVGSTPPPEALYLSLTGVEDLPMLRKAFRSVERLVSKKTDGLKGKNT